MKAGKMLNTSCVIIFLVIPALIIVGILIFGEKTSLLSAKESYQKASEILENQAREAVLTKISAGSIPRDISGPMSAKERRGRGDPLDICFYLKKEDKFIYFTNTGKEQVQEKESKGHCYVEDPSEINIEKWKIDSEEAVEIAKNKTKELGKGKFIIVMLKLSQEKGNVPIWEIEFLPPKVGGETIGLKFTIDAEAGEIIKTEEPIHSYINI